MASYRGGEGGVAKTAGAALAACLKAKYRRSGGWREMHRRRRINGSYNIISKQYYQLLYLTD